MTADTRKFDSSPVISNVFYHSRAVRVDKHEYNIFCRPVSVREVLPFHSEPDIVALHEGSPMASRLTCIRTDKKDFKKGTKNLPVAGTRQLVALLCRCFFPQSVERSGGSAKIPDKLLMMTCACINYPLASKASRDAQTYLCMCMCLSLWLHFRLVGKTQWFYFRVGKMQPNIRYETTRTCANMSSTIQATLSFPAIQIPPPATKKTVQRMHVLPDLVRFVYSL